LISETNESIFGQLVGLFGRGISPSQVHYLHRTAEQKNADTHPCLERDLNPRPQCSSERLKTVRALEGTATGTGDWNFIDVSFLKWLFLGEGLTIPHRKNPTSYEILHRASELGLS